MRAVAGLLAIVFIGSVSAIFDCRRDPSNLCKNGGACKVDGTACENCGSGFEGYDCSVVSADLSHADCTPTNPCNNGGTCHKAAAAAAVTCLCTSDYTGPTCDVKRYDLTCDTGANTMTMIIRPYIDTFAGTINVEGQTDAACAFTGNPLTLASLSNGAAPCGVTTDTTVDGNTNSERVVIVRFITGQLTTRDERVTFTCGTGTTVSKSSAAVAVTAVDAGLHPKDQSNVPLDTDVSYAVTTGGSAIAGPVNLGEDIKVTIDLTPDGLQKYQAVRFKQCTAGSHVLDTETGYVSKLFIDAFCLHDDLRSLIVTPMSRTSTAVDYVFDLFKFDVTSDLVITCIVEVCATATDCDPELCGAESAGSESGFGRKKRQAGTIEKILQRSIEINDPLQAAAKTLQEFKETKACYQSWEMTATVVALSVALLLVLLLCIILIIKAILNRRGRTTYREDASETTSTSHFPHLPTIVSNKA